MQGGIILSFLILFQSLFFITNAHFDAFNHHRSPPSSQSPSPSDGNKQVYMVYMSAQPPEGLNLESYYLKVLSSVLGSEEAAKEALIYTYTIIAGFSAKLTPDEASRLEKQAGVVYARKEKHYTLDGGDI